MAPSQARKPSSLYLHCMAPCLSFVQSREYTAAWARCAQHARPGDIFCAIRRDAIDGVMMGILHDGERHQVNKTQIEEACLEARRRTLAVAIGSGQRSCGRSGAKAFVAADKSDAGV